MGNTGIVAASYFKLRGSRYFCPWKYGGRSESGTMFQREVKKAVASVQFQLGADIGAMGFNRALADEKLRCNLPAGFVLRHKAENAQFRFGEIFQTRLF